MTPPSRPDRPGSASRGHSAGKEPSVAVFLTWLLPGAGHLYLGRTGFGLVALVLVEGLYWLGLTFSQGRVFEFLDPELRGRFATALTPEAGNLGALVYHMRNYGFGSAVPAAWPPRIMLGSTLTALSGMLNLCLMVQAHLDARAPAPARVPADSGRALPPALAVFLAWLVPGLGHWLQGRRLRAAIVFALLVGFFAWGTLLADLSNLSRERHFYFWSGQFLLGLPGLVAEFVSGRPAVAAEIPQADVGLTFASVAGLLNVLAMLDVYGWAEAVWQGEDPLDGGAEEAGPVAADGVGDGSGGVA